MEQSSPNSSGNSLTTMVSRRLVKINCERCDAEKGSKLQPELSVAPKIENENCSNAVPVSIKVENAFELMEPVKSETYSIDANDSDQSAVGNGKQSDCHLQASAFVKIEKEESPVIRELVGHLPRNLTSGNHDKKPLLKIVKLEGSKLHAEVHFEMEKEEEDNTAKTAVGNLVDRCLEHNASVEDDTVNFLVNKSSSDCLQPNLCDKKEEKCHITKELVAGLPGSSTSRECDEKCILKIVKLTKTGTAVESELQSNAQTIGQRNPSNGKTPSKVLQPKNKVSSKGNPKNKSGVKPYSCTECPYTANFQSCIKQHMRVHSGERLFECKDCAKKSKTKAALKRHMSTHSKEKPFECKDCSARFKWKSNLTQHLKRHSNERGYFCSVCPSKFKTEEDLKQHFATHINETRFECAYCNRRFKTKCLLRKHIRIHVNEKLYSCSYCPSTFRLPQYLKTHLIVKHNSSEKLYTCAHCSKKFKLKSILVQHIVAHSNEKRHSCPQCPKTFNRRGNLEIHLRCHTGEKPYSCPQCPAKYSHCSTLKRHLESHSNEKCFPCDQCPDSFRLNAQLNRHKKTHETERLYCCAHCPHRSKTKNVLSMHLKVVHFCIEKRHECSQCSYRTYCSSDLKKHLVVHTGEKPYACVHCPSRYSRKSNLSRHSKRHLEAKLSSD